MEPFVSDAGKISSEASNELKKAAVAYEEGRHSLAYLKGCDVIVKSPGIPDDAEIVVALRKHGLPILSEIAFAAHFAEPEKMIAITGSNGKTTTTGLTAHLLQRGGLHAVAAGNIGKSFARVLAESPADYYVLEVSSFQLDDARGFRPHIAALLNITPDHLDRYAYSMEHYAFAKLKIATEQVKGDYFLYNENDAHTREFLPAFAKSNPLQGQRLPLHLPKGSNEKNLLVEGHRYSLERSQLMGKHNLLNALFAVRMALLTGLSPNIIQKGLDTFRNAPHRLERVAEIDGVLFVNDSKATNVDAVQYALDAMKRPVVWIAGGTDKGNVYEDLFPLVKEKVKALICLGADNEKLKTAFESLLPNAVFETRTTDEAVQIAREVANEGDVVLLSPACASFDLFKNYEDRGNRFKESVQKLLTTETM